MYGMATAISANKIRAMKTTHSGKQENSNNLCFFDWYVLFKTHGVEDLNCCPPSAHSEHYIQPTFE